MLDAGADDALADLRSRGIHRAVLNVVTNAIDAARIEPPRVGHGLLTEHNPAGAMLVQIEVRDNGSGIPPENGQVVQLFVSTKGGRGTGLGLPVSQKIVKEHGGKIPVESRRPRGRFTLELPAVSPGTKTLATSSTEG